jgi:hypothetical protein
MYEDREPRVGLPVVFIQGSDEGPMTKHNLRRHPALIAAVGVLNHVDLVYFPFGTDGYYSRVSVPKWMPGLSKYACSWAWLDEKVDG